MSWATPKIINLHTKEFFCTGSMQRTHQYSDSKKKAGFFNTFQD